MRYNGIYYYVYIYIYIIIYSFWIIYMYIYIIEIYNGLYINIMGYVIYNGYFKI